MSNPIQSDLERLPRTDRDAMLAVTNGQAFNLFMEFLIRARTAYLNESLDLFKEDSLLPLGRLLGERASYSRMRDRILAFKEDLKRINDAEDKRLEEEEKQTGKE